MKESDKNAAIDYFCESLWPLLKRTFGDKLDVMTQEQIADVVSAAFEKALDDLT